MKLLARFALEVFQGLPVEKQRDTLLEYVMYVEREVEKNQMPDMLLEWYLQQEGE